MGFSSPFDPETETSYVEQDGIFEPVEKRGIGKVECVLLIWSIMSSVLLLIEILLFDSSDGLLGIGIILCVIIGIREHKSAAPCGDTWNWMVVFVVASLVNVGIVKMCDMSYTGLLCVYLVITGVILWRQREQQEEKD